MEDLRKKKKKETYTHYIIFLPLFHKGERGRVRFSSLRRGEQWHTIEFVMIRESDGKMVDLGNEFELSDTGAPVTSSTTFA